MSIQDHSPVDAIAEVLADVPDLVFVFTPDARYLYINNAAAEFLGDDPLDVIGSHWRDLAYPEEVMEPLQAWIERAAETRQSARYTLRSSKQRGSRLMDFSLTPLRGATGEVYAVLLIARDIDEYASRPADRDR